MIFPEKSYEYCVKGSHPESSGASFAHIEAIRSFISPAAFGDVNASTREGLCP